MVFALFTGLIGAGAIAWVGYRTRSLSASGAVAAAIVGALIVAAGGLSWAMLMLLFFGTSSALSHLPNRVARRVEARGERRDAVQVLANGGTPLLAAVLQLAAPAPWHASLYAGALAAATADTWATEIGSRFGGIPRTVLSGAAVPPGTSGGTTRAGTAAAVAGAFLIGFASLAVHGGVGSAAAVAIAGFFGALFDSVLGATIQERRHCPTCHEDTEQVRHAPCDTRTRITGGVPGISNDVVNAASCLAAGTFAVLVASL